MLSKRYRLTTNLFDQLKKQKPLLYSKSSYLTLKYYKSEDKRFAVVISNKLISKANKRVKIKRLIKRFLVDNLNNLPNGFYVVIVTGEGILFTSYEEVCAEVDKVLSKVPKS